MTYDENTLPPRTHNQPPKSEDPPRYLRKELLEQAQSHRSQDTLRHGTFGTREPCFSNHSDGKFVGCSVGCFAYGVVKDFFEDGKGDSAFEIVSDYYQIPHAFLELQESFFESAFPTYAFDMHVNFAAAIYLAPNIILWDEIKEQLMAKARTKSFNGLLHHYVHVTHQTTNPSTVARVSPVFAEMTYACIMTNGRSFTAPLPRY